jgi:tetraacyldisaccharide 4'-kinase
MAKRSRYILFPFSIIYGLTVKIRNQLFDRNILRSATFDFPLICVGNLAAGGTGKTPMVEYLVNTLSKKYRVATLSRGYKRKTKGFFIANENTKTYEIGDEPMQLHLKFPDVTVAVAEERIMGIPQVLNDKPGTEIIILDDAFQHREVNAGLNILLTDYNHLYTKDVLLPAGNLRDTKSSSKRAQIIIVTKCKDDLDSNERKKIIDEIKPLTEQKVFFTKITYNRPYHLFSKKEIVLERNMEVLLVCGIANPQKITEVLRESVSSFQIQQYKDHHDFHGNDIKEIMEHFSEIKNSEKIILTTEKDAVKLLQFQNVLNDLPIYVLPMQHQFLFHEGQDFDKELITFINSFQKNLTELN